MFDFKKILKKEKKVNKKIISYDWFIIKKIMKENQICLKLLGTYIFLNYLILCKERKINKMNLNIIKD